MEALEFCGRALVLRIKILGLEHEKIAESHFCLGELYMSLGEYAPAIKEFKICKDFGRDIFSI